MSFWLLYLITILPNIGAVFAFIMLFSGIAIILSGIAYCAAEVDGLTKWSALCRRNIRIAILIVIISSPVTILIPSATQMYTLVGGYYVINLEGMSDLPPKVVEAMNTFLSTYVETKEQ